MKKSIVFLLALTFISCLKEVNPFLSFDGIEPVDINDGWDISSPDSENIDNTALTDVYSDIYNNNDLWQLRSLLVFRNGNLVAESYLKDKNDIDDQRPIWSCTKQVLGVLSGLAVEQGVISSINDPISTYLEDELVNHSDKNDITIADILTMRSGIGFDETSDVSTLLQQIPDNTIDFILSLPMIYSSGETFNYNSGEPHLLSACIQNSLDSSLENWADDELFSKIGFSNYSWLEYDGYNFGGYGISTTPRELAKIAQLVLNNGEWNGDQLINSSWINEMVTTKTSTGENSDYSFGYLWWINESENVYFMAGSGGQYACIIPDKNMIVVATSEYDTDGDLELDFDTFLNIVNKIRATAN